LPNVSPLRRLDPEIAAPAAVFLASLVVHVLWSAWPDLVVFDESFYGKAAVDLLNNRFSFDVHPPLARILFWISAKVGGVEPDFYFSSIGVPFPHPGYFGIRLLPRLVGVFLPLVVYGVGREIKLTVWAAFVAAMLATLDNALLVMSRFALPDIFIVFFGFLSLYAVLRATRTGSWGLVVAAGLCAGVATSVKWSGLSFTGIAVAICLAAYLKDRKTATLAKGALVLALVATVYVASFAALFEVGYRTGKDAAYMTPAFKATLEGPPDEFARFAKPAAPENFVGKFRELNRMMAGGVNNIKSGHRYASKWYSWPVTGRTVLFWRGYKAGREASVYLIGNPVVWWLSTLAMAALLVSMAGRIPAALRRRDGSRFAKAEAVVAMCYVANYAPFVLITREMFLYHYLAALVAAILALAIMVEKSRRPVLVGTTIIVCAFAAFVWFAPLTYGLGLPKGGFEARMWLPGWV
jgi:dolichyl-phosphate-mannose--protein O-mannosyl transferase